MAYRTTLVREPAVAGAFYPADPGALQEMVDRLLAEAPRYETEPAALIVPHAGYIYSGHVAAWGFRQLEGRPYDAVVVLGTNHVEPFFHEISVWARGAWRTPLGEIPIDEELADALLAAGPPLRFVPEVHLEEHSIEVELPFLQRLFPGLRFVPVMIGEPSPENIEALAEALARPWPAGGPLSSPAATSPTTRGMSTPVRWTSAPSAPSSPWMRSCFATPSRSGWPVGSRGWRR